MKRRVERLKPRVFGIIWFFFALALMISMIAASYILTQLLYHLLRVTPPALFVQIMNTLIGLTLTGTVAGLLGRYANKHGWVPERNVFAPILEALDRIARGDFRVRLESGGQENQMVTILADGVNRMALELEQMEALRQEFISNVSHEIQSPLTSIRGFAQALQNDQLSVEERHHYLDIIEAESTRMSRITADLLRMAALDSDQSRFQPVTYRLDRQIRALILACEPQWSAKTLEMNVNLEAVEVTADEDLLSQVWTNLIHNSVKFTPENGQVCIDLRREGDQVAFQIRDTGVGIPPEDQARIFERFYKADKSRTRSSGSGLGLAIAKKIVEMHKGTIGVESAPGAGTTFTVRLPAPGPEKG